MATRGELIIIEAARELADVVETHRWQVPQALPALDAFYAAYKIHGYQPQPAPALQGEELT